MDAPKELRSIFSKEEVASKFIEEFYFEEIYDDPTHGKFKVKINCFYIIG